MVLARLLSPKDFGVYALALVILTLLESANELGVSLALVQWGGDVRRIAPTVMTIAITSSVLLYAATWALAPALTHAMGAPEATGVLRLLAFSVVIDGVATVPVGLLNRGFHQQRRFVGDAVNFSSSTAVTLVLAVLGAGPLSFACGRVVGSGLATVVYTALSPLRVRPAGPGARRAACSSSGCRSPGRACSCWPCRTSTTSSSGSSSPRPRSASTPWRSTSRAGRSPSSPRRRGAFFAGRLFQLATDRAALSRSFARGLGLLALVTAPVCALLVGLAEPMLAVVYGARWTPAAAALVPLAGLGLIRVGLFVCYDLLVAIGRNRVLLALQGLWLVSLAPGLVLGARAGGIRGAAVAHLVTAAVVVVPAFAVVLARNGIDVRSAGRTCLRPLVGGVLVVLATSAVRAVVPGALEQLLAGGALGVRRLPTGRLAHAPAPPAGVDPVPLEGRHRMRPLVSVVIPATGTGTSWRTAYGARWTNSPASTYAC